MLTEEDFEWHGDSLNGDLPYLVKYDTGTIVAFSSNMECNDLPLYALWQSAKGYAGNLRGLAGIRAQV